jgi:hypothetical protein
MAMTPPSLLSVNHPLSRPKRHEAAQIRSEIGVSLVGSCNGDGGWPYVTGKRSRIEPTCWALLALGQSETRSPNVDPLRLWPRHTNWLIDVPGAPPNNAFNALAALTLLQDPSSASDAVSIVTQIVASKGIQLKRQDQSRQDNSLMAWSWIDGTFSWVEPTAWCLLLLKKAPGMARIRGADERIRTGEQMLLDRACRIGGWNYGNSNVYGKELWPYVPTTALALLAMQDRRNDPVIVRALAQLQEDVRSERSAVALALTIICLRVYGVLTDMLEQQLIELSAGGEAALGPAENVLGRAMTLYALSDASRPMTAFTV